LRALAWSDYLKSHAVRTYAAGIAPATDGAYALLDKIKTGKVANNFRRQDIYLKGWAHLNSPDAVTPALNLLCDLGYLKRADHAVGIAGGRPSITYRINPKIAGGV
jgi:putative DNA primase/helicase